LPQTQPQTHSQMPKSDSAVKFTTAMDDFRDDYNDDASVESTGTIIDDEVAGSSIKAKRTESGYDSMGEEEVPGSSGKGSGEFNNVGNMELVAIASSSSASKSSNRVEIAPNGVYSGSGSGSTQTRHNQTVSQLTDSTISATHFHPFSGSSFDWFTQNMTQDTLDQVPFFFPTTQERSPEISPNKFSENLIGRKVGKTFPQFGYFEGIVTSYDDPFYNVRYSDGDEEEYELEALRNIIISDTSGPVVHIGRPMPANGKRDLTELMSETTIGRAGKRKENIKNSPVFAAYDALSKLEANKDIIMSGFDDVQGITTEIFVDFTDDQLWQELAYLHNQSMEKNEHITPAQIEKLLS